MQRLDTVAASQRTDEARTRRDETMIYLQLLWPRHAMPDGSVGLQSSRSQLPHRDGDLEAIVITAHASFFKVRRLLQVHAEVESSREEFPSIGIESA
jgi:hypothetical protein